MEWLNKLKIFALFLGDAVVFYAGLFAALALRYRSDFWRQFIGYHFAPFTVILAVWLAIFYVAGLYDLRRLRNNLDFIKTLFLSLFIGAAAAVFFFYLVPVFGITPRTNLFVFVAIFSAVEIIWRRAFNAKASSKETPNKIILVGNSATADSVYKIITSNPQLGYEIKKRLREEEAYSAPRVLSELAGINKINLIVVPRHFKNNERIVGSLYKLLSSGVEIRDLANFYELAARKVPLADLEETWFLENLIGHRRFYDPVKRAAEFLFAAILEAALLPLELVVALIIKITSRGPVIYKQARVGQNGRIFTLYKFRTMAADAEKGGAKWSGEGDKRITRFGKFLRYTHLDELPQLVNIMKGDVSFVGPRPERPEFTGLLEKKIPYYEIRHLIKPGVTGWAQINYRYGASVEDAYEKLQYDIYYLKNRSPLLDLAIVLKTIKTFFITPK